MLLLNRAAGADRLRPFARRRRGAIARLSEALCGRRASARPHFVDGTDLDVDETERQRKLRTTSSVISVGTFADFFGHDTQTAAFGCNALR
jgi:hypothetical protein